MRSNFEAIGTVWGVEVLDDLSADEWAELMQRLYVRIQAFDKAYSRFRADSLITKMSMEAGTYELPPDAYDLIEFYKQLYDVTDGKVTPLIGQVMSDAGYDAEYSLKQGDMKPPPTWDDVLSYDQKHVTLKKPALLDFGAAGKGYLVDIVSDIIAQTGCTSYTINAGGDILHRSAKHDSLRIGLENPYDNTEAIGVITISNKSLCASSGSKRQWGNMHHIINPATLRSTEAVTATWVVADDTLMADGLATALFFTSAEVLQKHFTFDYALLRNDMSLEYSKGLIIETFNT